MTYTELYMLDFRSPSLKIFFNIDIVIVMHVIAVLIINMLPKFFLGGGGGGHVPPQAPPYLWPCDEAWLQAQLSLSRGGLGLRSLSSHAAAAYIASLCSSGFSSLSSLHLTSAIGKFNSSISPSDVVSVESLAQQPPIQKALSAKIDDFQFNQLFNSSSLADRARLLSISSPHASSWLSVVPSKGLGLHLNPDQFQVAIKWWLGIDTSGGSLCSFYVQTLCSIH